MNKRGKEGFLRKLLNKLAEFGAKDPASRTQEDPAEKSLDNPEVKNQIQSHRELDSAKLGHKESLLEFSEKLPIESKDEKQTHISQEFKSNNDIRKNPVKNADLKRESLPKSQTTKVKEKEPSIDPKVEERIQLLRELGILEGSELPQRFKRRLYKMGWKGSKEGLVILSSVSDEMFVSAVREELKKFPKSKTFIGKYYFLINNKFSAVPSDNEVKSKLKKFLSDKKLKGYFILKILSDCKKSLTFGKLIAKVLDLFPSFQGKSEILDILGDLTGHCLVIEFQNEFFVPSGITDIVQSEIRSFQDKIAGYLFDFKVRSQDLQDIILDRVRSFLKTYGKEGFIIAKTFYGEKSKKRKWSKSDYEKSIESQAKKANINISNLQHLIKELANNLLLVHDDRDQSVKIIPSIKKIIQKELKRYEKEEEIKSKAKEEAKVFLIEREKKGCVALEILYEDNPVEKKWEKDNLEGVIKAKLEELGLASSLTKDLIGSMQSRGLIIVHRENGKTFIKANSLIKEQVIEEIKNFKLSLKEKDIKLKVKEFRKSISIKIKKSDLEMEEKGIKSEIEKFKEFFLKEIEGLRAKFKENMFKSRLDKLESKISKEIRRLEKKLMEEKTKLGVKKFLEKHGRKGYAVLKALYEWEGERIHSRRLTARASKIYGSSFSISKIIREAVDIYELAEENFRNYFKPIRNLKVLILKILDEYQSNELLLKKLTPEAQMETKEIEKMNSQFELHLLKILESKLETILEFGRSISPNGILKYFEEMFGPILAFDCFLSVVQQYSIADAPIYNLKGNFIGSTGFNLAFFGPPGTGKTFATSDIIIGNDKKGIPPHGIPGRNRYCGGMTAAKFIRLGEAYAGKKFNFIVPEFNDWFKYKGMIEVLKLAMEQKEVRYETKNESIGPYKFTSFFSVNYNTKMKEKGYKVTVSDPNFSAIEDRMLCMFQRMTRERFMAIRESQSKLRLGYLDFGLADMIRDHVTLVYAIETEHPAVKDRFPKKHIVITTEIEDKLKKADDLLFKDIENYELLEVSARLSDRAIKLACAASLINYFGSEEDLELKPSKECVNLALRFYLEEMNVRSQEKFGNVKEILSKII